MTGALPEGCDPDQTSLPIVDRCATATFFDDVYLASAPTTIDNATLQACLIANGLACTAYELDGVTPVTHAERFVYDFGDTAHARTGTVANPTCNNGYVEMDPGYYASIVKIGTDGSCVKMNPGIYMFGDSFLTCCDGYVQGNAVFLYNAAPAKIAKVTKSAVCLTAPQDGPYPAFLFYQNPLNTTTFVVTSDSALHIGGIIYNPSGGVEVNGSAAGTVGGLGQCLGESVQLGGSIVGTTVKVKSDGSLAITALEGAAASGGGGWVRLYE